MGRGGRGENPLLRAQYLAHAAVPRQPAPIQLPRSCAPLTRTAKSRFNQGLGMASGGKKIGRLLEV